MSSSKQNKFIAFGIVACLLIALAVFLQRPDASPKQKPDPAAKKSSSSPQSEASKSLPSQSQVLTKETQEVPEKNSALAQKLLEIQDYPDQKEWPGLLLDLMADASIDDVKALLAASDGPLGAPAFRDEMKIAAYERWYVLDPAEALRAIDTSTMTPHRRVAAMEVFLDDWSSREPERVAAFLKEGELQGIPSDQAYGAVARGASLAGAVALVDEALARIENPKLQSYAVRAAARQLQRDHGELFEDWMTALPTEHQGAALAESAWILSGKHLDQALANLARLEQVETERVPVTRARVVVKWAEEEPAKAAEWVAKQNLQGDEREALFANVLNVWFSDDRDVAVAWVESLIAKGEIDEAFMNRVVDRM